MPPASWPDPTLIAEIANGFFKASPHSPAPTLDSPGVSIAPPTPSLTPSPSLTTTLAPVAPAASPFGTPDLPTTIPSVAPTPNISAPVAPSRAQHPFPDFPDVPQPGASPGLFAPTYPVSSDLEVPPTQFGLLAIAPLTYAASPFEGPEPAAGPSSFYFLPAAELQRPRSTPGLPSVPSELPGSAQESMPFAPPVAERHGGFEWGASSALGKSYRELVPLPESSSFDLEESRVNRSIPSTSESRRSGAAPLPVASHTKDVPTSSEAQLPGEIFYFLSEDQALRAKASPQQGATVESPPLPLDLSPQLLPDSGLATRPFDPYAIKRDFPILREQINGRPLVWLDNAATTQKPQAVIDRLIYFYEHENSNIHRGAHAMAARATDAYEAARDKVARFLNAGSDRDIIFVRGATEGINLVAQSWGRRNVKEGDEIVITWLEHHANIVPWQQLCAEVGARLRVAPVNDRGEVVQDQYERLLGPRTRMVAIPHVSNALGTIVPVIEMTAAAHRHGACVLVDGAQSVSHMSVDVEAIDCDFFVFSGHKIFAPTGIGVVYGKPTILAHMPPWQGGGNMIADVTFEKTLYQPPPGRFEAGTGSIADAVGLGAALDYVESIGRAVIERYEHELLVYATGCMSKVPGLILIGTAQEKASVLSFVLDGHRSEDVGKALNQEGIAVRAGHHCAQPILRRFGLESTVRPSLAFYNTREDVDALVAALLRLQAGRT